jgi:hypothetical protein
MCFGKASEINWFQFRYQKLLCILYAAPKTADKPIQFLNTDDSHTFVTKLLFVCQY